MCVSYGSSTCYAVLRTCSATSPPHFSASRTERSYARVPESDCWRHGIPLFLHQLLGAWGCNLHVLSFPKRKRAACGSGSILPLGLPPFGGPTACRLTPQFSQVVGAEFVPTSPRTQVTGPTGDARCSKGLCPTGHQGSVPHINPDAIKHLFGNAHLAADTLTVTLGFCPSPSLFSRIFRQKKGENFKAILGRVVLCEQTI